MRGYNFFLPFFCHSHLDISHSPIITCDQALHIVDIDFIIYESDTWTNPHYTHEPSSLEDRLEASGSALGGEEEDDDDDNDNDYDDVDDSDDNNDDGYDHKDDFGDN